MHWAVKNLSVDVYAIVTSPSLFPRSRIPCKEWYRRAACRRQMRAKSKLSTIKEILTSVATTHAGSHLNEILPHFCPVEHCVKGCDLVDFNGRHFQHFRDLQHIHSAKVWMRERGNSHFENFSHLRVRNDTTEKEINRLYVPCPLLRAAANHRIAAARGRALG